MENLDEVCSVCRQPTRGGFTNYSGELEDGTPVIGIDGTPDRDFNVCDLCNAAVHFRCSAHPESGLCDACYAKAHEGMSTRS